MLPALLNLPATMVLLGSLALTSMGLTNLTILNLNSDSVELKMGGMLVYDRENRYEIVIPTQNETYVHVILYKDYSNEDCFYFDYEVINKYGELINKFYNSDDIENEWLNFTKKLTPEEEFIVNYYGDRIPGNQEEYDKLIKRLKRDALPNKIKERWGIPKVDIANLSWQWSSNKETETITGIFTPDPAPPMEFHKNVDDAFAPFNKLIQKHPEHQNDIQRYMYMYHVKDKYFYKHKWFRTYVTIDNEGNIVDGTITGDME